MTAEAEAEAEASPTVLATATRPTAQARTASSAKPAVTPTSATNANSGSAVSDAGQAQTTTNNTQLSAGITGGGDGALVVENQHSSTIVDSAAASAQSGISVALAPTLGPGTPAPAGVTTAASGSTSATGVTAQNAVSNTAMGGVRVVGENDSSVNLTSSSTVNVANTGASAAESGQAWAVAAGAAGAPSGVSTPGVAAAVTGTSAAVNGTGLQATNNLSSAVSGTMVVPAGASTPGSINIASDQSVNVVAKGAAVSASTAVAAGVGTPEVAGARAASGSASAHGLDAQNTVNTGASVNVNIGGDNFAPIRIVIESITNIINLGLGVANSGDATAGSGAAQQAAGQTAQQAAGGAASSGSAQAVGAQVQNTVDLRTSAAVHVAGDNHNPINIMLNLATNLFNWGWGSASTGDVQATGSGGTAASGSASATGLQVTNLVNMWADAGIDIEGDNYAPITVYIRFTTNIGNYGGAAATTGDVAAGTLAKTTVTSAAQAQPTAQSGTNGVVGSHSHARSGDAIAIANTVDQAVSSVQLSGAGVGGSWSADTISQITNRLPNVPRSMPEIFSNPIPTPNIPDLKSGVDSSTGDAAALGMHSTITQNNTQLVGCGNGGTVRCEANNFASLSVTSRDLPTNPLTDGNGSGNGNGNGNGGGKGGSNAGSGSAFVNATPTPTPTRVAQSSTNTQRSTSTGRGSSGGSRTRTLVVETRAVGHMVSVDLWGQWPGRRLPPMPGMRGAEPAGSDVVANLGGWPGLSELPLPELAAPAPPPAPQPRPRVGGRVAPVSVLADMPAEDDFSVPLLAIVEADFWSAWPAAEQLPMPWQAARGVPPAAVTAVVDEPQDAGASATELGLTTLVALVLGALGGSRRGRMLMGGFAAWVSNGVGAALAAARGAVSGVTRVQQAAAGALRGMGSQIGRQTARGLAIVRLALSMVRLTIGIFRIWH